MNLKDALGFSPPAGSGSGASASAGNETKRGLHWSDPPASSPVSAKSEEVRVKSAPAAAPWDWDSAGSGGGASEPEERPSFMAFQFNAAADAGTEPASYDWDAPTPDKPRDKVAPSPAGADAPSWGEAESADAETEGEASSDDGWGGSAASDEPAPEPGTSERDQGGLGELTSGWQDEEASSPEPDDDGASSLASESARASAASLMRPLEFDDAAPSEVSDEPGTTEPTDDATGHDGAWERDEPVPPGRGEAATRLSMSPASDLFRQAPPESHENSPPEPADEEPEPADPTTVLAEHLNLAPPKSAPQGAPGVAIPLEAPFWRKAQRTFALLLPRTARGQVILTAMVSTVSAAGLALVLWPSPPAPPPVAPAPSAEAHTGVAHEAPAPAHAEPPGAARAPAEPHAAGPAAAAPHGEATPAPAAPAAAAPHPAPATPPHDGHAEPGPEHGAGSAKQAADAPQAHESAEEAHPAPPPRAVKAAEPEEELGPAWTAAPVAPPQACRVRGKPKRIAQPVFEGVEPEILALNAVETLLGFAVTPTEARGVRLNATTLETEVLLQEPGQRLLLGVVPRLPEGKLSPFTVDRAGLGASQPWRTLTESVPMSLARSNLGLHLVRPNGDRSVPLWPMDPEAILSRPALELAKKQRFAIAFRRGEGEVLTGWFDAHSLKRTPLRTVPFTKGPVEPPALAVAGTTALIATAARNPVSNLRQIELALSRTDGGVEILDRLRPLFAVSRDCFAPRVEALADGRWVVQWTERKQGKTEIRLLTLSESFDPVGALTTVSPPELNALGGTLLNVDGGLLSVFYLKEEAATALYAGLISCE